MSKKVTGIAKNGIEEECRWNKSGLCPRHTIHKGMPITPVSIPEGLADEPETISPMAVFDNSYDENMELAGKGFIIDDEETLKDLGLPEAYSVEVEPINGYAVITISGPKGIEVLKTGYDVEKNDNYMSLNQLKTILDNIV